jgi:hypothetical protein
MRFMQAHGQRPGPGQRPVRAGALSGGIGGLVAIPILQWSGAVASIAMNLGIPDWLVPVLYVAVATFTGSLYGAVFQRAASDRRGGWLFGISYGFLWWMLGPVTLLQSVRGRPLAVGVAAMGVLTAHLASGLVLGLSFRPAHNMISKGLKRPGDTAISEPMAQEMGQQHAR